MLFFLLDVEVQGPSGLEILRLSNTRYVTDAGIPYQATITQASMRDWNLAMTGLDIRPSGLARTRIVGRDPRPIVVLNDAPNSIDPRRYDFLFFEEGYAKTRYKVTGKVTGKIATCDPWKEQPAESDFVTIFTGRSARKPIRKYDTVEFLFESAAADTKAPLLTKRMTGMGGHVHYGGSTAPGSAPQILAGQFSVQMYLNLWVDEYRTVLSIQDASSADLWRIWIDPSAEEVKLSVRWSGGTDEYSLFSISGYTGASGRDRFRFLTVVWAGTTFYVWEDKTLRVDGAPVLHPPSGAPSHVALGEEVAPEAKYSSCRIWSRAFSSTEVFSKQGPLRVDEEKDLEVAWEIDFLYGATVTDHSGKGRHILLPQSDLWGSSPLHGEPDFEGKPIPLLLGESWAVPLTMYDTRLNRGMVSAALMMSELRRVYSQGMTLTPGITSTAVILDIDHLNGLLYANAYGGTKVFGQHFAPGMTIRLAAGSGPGTFFDGDYQIEDVSPPPLTAVRPESDTWRFTLKIGDPGWTASGTNVFTTISVPPELREWQTGFYTLYENPHGAKDNQELVAIHLAGDVAYPDPLFATATGDPEILANLTPTPGVFHSPAVLSNVLAQALTKYGPRWDDTTFPPPDYHALDYRVGYYVNDNRSTRQVVDDLAGGCLVWVVEAADGSFSLVPFEFPEEIETPPIEIGEDDVETAERTPRGDDGSYDDLVALRLQYAPIFVKLDASTMPPAVGADVRALLRNEWRELPIGEEDKSDAETPIFQTYEIRRGSAQRIGERALRIAQGVRTSVVKRYDPVAMFKDFAIGAKVHMTLPSFGWPAALGVLVGVVPKPARGLVELVIWTDI